MKNLVNRLAAGSAQLAHQLRARLADWIARGRREDLSGWKAALGPAARSFAVLVIACGAARVVRAVPVLLWLLVPAWTVAAYRAAPPLAAAGPVGDEHQELPADPRADLARWVLQIIGERPGVHLYELYPAMRRLPGREGLSDPQLRAALRVLGITVTRSLRVPPVEGRSGVRREDVEALLPRAESWRGERHGDAGQRPDSPVLSGVGEGAESA